MAARVVMLDTNIASAIIRGAGPALAVRLRRTPLTHACISSVTEGELRYGLAKHSMSRPAGRALGESVGAFLKCVAILPWDSSAAAAYGELRATLEARGTPLGNLNTMIAAHALATGSVLATNDKAFKRVPRLAVEDWLLA